jgi:hypothetical protein
LTSPAEESNSSENEQQEHKWQQTTAPLSFSSNESEEEQEYQAIGDEFLKENKEALDKFPSNCNTNSTSSATLNGC